MHFLRGGRRGGRGTHDVNIILGRVVTKMMMLDYKGGRGGSRIWEKVIT